jgi:hypothetical protein
MRALGPLAVAGAAALLGCGSSTTEIPSSEGRIQITVSTSGAPPQSSEYLITLNGGQPLSVAPNGSATYEGVAEGTYVVLLFALADNCVVSGSANQRSVKVEKGEIVQVAFAVLCAEPVSGGFRVAVQTMGTPVDEDGYQLSVSGTPLRTIGVNAEEHYEGLEPGAHLITLKDVADFCDVAGGNPQRFTVVPGKAVRVVLIVRCGDGRGDPLL